MSENQENENAETGEGVSAGNRIEVPAAVFTATLGCGWTRLPEFVEEIDARNSKKAVLSILKNNGIEPSDVELVKGVQYSGGEYAIAFSLRNVTGLDQAGRDADYYACAFVKKELMGELDFNRLLQHKYFVTSYENPPDSIDCSDMVCGGLLGQLLLLPELDKALWLIASVKVNGGKTLYLKCDNWNDAIAEELRSALLSVPEGNKEQEDGREDEHADGHEYNTDNTKATTEGAGGNSAEINLRGEYEKLKLYYETLQEQNKKFGQRDKEWRNCVEQLKQEKDELSRQNDECLQKNGEQLSELEGLKRALSVAQNKITKEQDAHKSDFKYWIIITGILSFVFGVCLASAFAMLLLSK